MFKKLGQKHDVGKKNISENKRTFFALSVSIFKRTDLSFCLSLSP